MQKTGVRGDATGPICRLCVNYSADKELLSLKSHNASQDASPLTAQCDQQLNHLLLCIQRTKDVQLLVVWIT